MKKILTALILILIPLSVIADTEVKQSTERVIIVGPFVDLDGYTPQTDITLSTADEAELIKLGGGFTDISGSTWNTTGVDGWYELTLTSGNTDTLGDITIVIQDDSDCLPVWMKCSVLTANFYDSKYGTEHLDVNVAEISDDSTAADNAELDYDGTGYNKSNSTIGTCTTNTDMRGTDSAYTGTPPTAVAIRQEIDSNSTQLAAIVEDTGTTIPATLSTIWEKLKRLVF